MSWGIQIEADDAFVADIDLPGVQKDDVNVEMSDRELVVTAEIKEKGTDGRPHRRMRRTGRVTVTGSGRRPGGLAGLDGH
ncbi:Hsp20/alpha crystallin family protein [Nonomuraea sp. B12E4]|uniref:Hsp20/alpha crystallin family protein n=1 Tax=Nonomuraea sp. B12E4 TaxID=3153564 RepID=UPI00325D3AA1